MRWSTFILFLVPLMPLVASDLFTFTSSASSPSGSASYSFSNPDVSGVFDYVRGSVSSVYITGVTRDFGPAFPQNPVNFVRNPIADIYERADDFTGETLTFSLLTSAVETLRTAGPVRSGIIQYRVRTTGGFYSTDAGISTFLAAITGVSEAGISDGAHTYGYGSCQSTCDTGTVEAPFDLGTVFTTVASSQQTGTVNAPSGVDTLADVGFNLFEADGITPVDILETPIGTPAVPLTFTPEPGTFVLLALAGALAAAIVRCSRHQRVSN